MSINYWQPEDLQQTARSCRLHGWALHTTSLGLTRSLLAVIFQAKGLHMRGNPAPCGCQVLAVLVQCIPLWPLLSPAGQLPVRTIQQF